MLQRVSGPRLELISRLPSGRRRPTPLLFVHGAFTAAWCWDQHFLPYFADLGYEAHALSLRGHGGSEGFEHLSMTSLDDYVDDLASVAEGFATPPVLVGHSMGGIVVQHHLAEGAASGVVLIASVPPEGLMGPALGLALQDPAFFREISMIQHVHPRFATLGGARRALFSEAVPEHLVARHFARMQPESQRAIYDLSLLPLRLARLRIDAPLLVLGAEDDAFFTPRMVRATAHAFGTDAEIFPGMAHAVMLEPGWPRVAGRIGAWLDQQGL
ncbi:MAG: alpha/beta hydrolase [Betaproteobacteria bacterium]|nr:alpha/beta hydrolase [Betaproteobacteria bacterium]